MGALAELIKLGIKTASKQVDEVVPKAVSQIDETADILKTLGKKESDISDFHSKYFRGDDKTRYRSEDLQKEAMKLDEGLISLDDFIKARDKIKPLKTYGTVPPLNKQTDEAGNLIAPDVFDPMEIIGPMGKNKIDATGIIGVNKTIKEGERATSRFDLPAYNRYDRYIPVIQTLVDKVNKATGKVKKQFVKKGFSPTAVLTDVNFNYSPKQSFDIAKGLRGLSSDGKEYPLGKGIKLKKGDKKLGEKQPFATMEGNWKNLTPEEAYKYANEKIGTKEWTEVGFDPAARLSFYNRATGEPVFNAEEVIQVGAMLLARGIKKPTKKQLEKLNIKTKAGEVIRYKEGGSLLPVIKKQDGGDFDFGLSADDMAAAYEAAGIDTSSPSGHMDDTDAGLYADAYGQPTTNTMSNEDFMSALTGTDTRYNPLQSPEMKAMTSNPYYFNPNAPKDKEEADRQAKDVQLFENFKHYGVADPVAHMTPAEQKNAAILEMIEHNNRLAEEYNLYIDSSGRYRKGNFGDKDEYYKVEKEDPDKYADFDRDGKPTPEYLERIEAVRARLDLNPKFGGGQVLDGLDGAYMRKRNSKEKLEGMIGIQSRQYGGGLDDAYMNRRRSSAFAAPDATSAFDSPMSKNGLPTIYREQGGPLPITSVYGQGIPRIIYRENGGSFMDDADAQAYADVYGPADPGADDSAGDFGDEGGSYQKQMEAALSGQAPGTSKTADELLADTSLGYTPFELATIYRGKEGKDNQETAKRMAGQILSRDARTALMNALYGKVGGQGGWHGVEEFIANMTPQQLQNFNMAANGSSLFGDMGADDFSKGWRYGGAEGTLQDILEKSLEDEVDISDLTEQADYRKKYEEEFEKSQLSGFELSKAGLKGIASDIADLTSIQSKLTDDPFIMDQIAERMNARGLDFQPVNSFLAGAMDYGIPLLAGLPGTIAKGLSNLTGAGRTIGTVTKDGLSYNLSDTGKFSLNLDPQEVDYGNDPTPVKKRKPVQKAVASTTEEKPKEGIAGYYERLNKSRPAQSRVASNKYIEDLLEDLYPDPRNRPTLG